MTNIEYRLLKVMCESKYGYRTSDKETIKILKRLELQGYVLNRTPWDAGWNPSKKGRLALIAEEERRLSEADKRIQIETEKQAAVRHKVLSAVLKIAEKALTTFIK